MADFKTLNTRIGLKIDTLENWEKSTLGLLKGEIAIATVASVAGTQLTEPVCMIKIGEDGIKTFSQLDWNFYAKASDVVTACKSEEALTTFINGVITNAKLASAADLTALTGRVTTAEGDIDNLEGEIATLKGGVDEDGSVAKAIKDAIDALDLANTYAAKEHDHVAADITDLDDTIKGYDYATKAEAQGYADAKVASVTAGDASVTIGGTATAPTVAAKISADADNAITLEDDGLKVVIPDAAEYSIVKAENSGEYAAIYNLTKDGSVVGASINIPKDMVVKSGSVVTDPEGQAAGTYIELVLQNVDEPLYINVGSLIEYVTSGSAADDMVVVAVSDDHKVTATITDGSITLGKLATDVQTAIGKAHVHENESVLNGITADDVEAWDAAEQNAKDYADAELKKVTDTFGDIVTHNASEFATVGALAETNAEVAKKANDADLAAIAKTGSTDDLVQGSLVLVFDCGGSGVVAE